MLVFCRTRSRGKILKFSPKNKREFPAWLSDLANALRVLRLPRSYKANITYYREENLLEVFSGIFYQESGITPAPWPLFRFDDSFLKLKDLTRKQRREAIKKIIEKVLNDIYRYWLNKMNEELKKAEKAVKLADEYEGNVAKAYSISMEWHFKKAKKIDRKNQC